MKQLIYIVFIFSIGFGHAQNDSDRINNIKYQLELLSVDNSGLTESFRSDISAANMTLANFLKAISNIHNLNINVASELSSIPVNNSFSQVSVADLLVFLCKEFDLHIEFTGNILSVSKYVAPVQPEKQRDIPISFNPANQTISIDAKKDKLSEVFKRITDVSGYNLVYAQGLENELLTSYFVDAPFETAMYKLAMANNLYAEKTKGFWVFEDNSSQNPDGQNKRLLGARSLSSNFKILDLETQLLEVSFDNKPIAHIISEIGSALNIDIFTATPLDKAGNASIKAKSISFDTLLNKMFESAYSSSTSQNSQPTNNTAANRNNANRNAESKPMFNFKKEGNMYFFGTEDQLSIKKVEVVTLLHRSVELLSDPSGGVNNNSTSSRVLNNLSGLNDNYGNQFGNQFGNQYNSNSARNNNRGRNITTTNSQTVASSESADITSIFPEEIIEALDIKTDYELNCFYVNGPAPAVERFKKFAKEIDKPVPVILIDVMIIEAKKNATIDAGVSWGIGDSPTTTQGSLFPETNLTLGAKTVNKIIGSFNDFGGFNLGNVGPNFFATIKAMEANGDIKIKSTPKLATLNSHRATFSNGQTSFYAVTRRNIYGSDNPQTSEITNYLPIDAELGLTIKPSVSGDGQVLLDISVIQSSFGARVAEDAPPDVVSRNFSSIIRMRDQDIAILGGLEEQFKSNTGSGVPLLSKVPVIKWLFSKRKREASKSKLTVFIKPTVIY